MVRLRGCLWMLGGAQTQRLETPDHHVRMPASSTRPEGQKGQGLCLTWFFEFPAPSKCLALERGPIPACCLPNRPGWAEMSTAQLPSGSGRQGEGSVLLHHS